MRISKIIAAITSLLLILNVLTFDSAINGYIISAVAETEEDEYSVGEYLVDGSWLADKWIYFKPKIEVTIKYKKYRDHVEICDGYNEDYLKTFIVPETIEDLPVTAIYGCSFSILQNFSYSDDVDLITCGLGDWFKKYKESQPNGVIYLGKTAYDFKYTSYDEKYDIQLKDDTVGLCNGIYQGSQLTSIELPDSIEYIGGRAFDSCLKLETIHLPDNLKVLGSAAFYNCRNLKEITIPNGVEKIEDECFYQCENLKSVYLPDSVKEIGDNVFMGCKKLESVRLSDNITEFNTSGVDNGLFRNCENLKEINIPKKLKTIGPYTFESCKSLTSITLPDCLESIGAFAFYYCSSLESVSTESKTANVGECILPDNLIFYGDEAFSQDKLSTLIIPSKLKGIRFIIFYNFSTVKLYNPECEIIEKLYGDNDVYTYSSKSSLLLYGFDGSVAQRYADEKGIPFVLLDSSDVKGDCNGDNIVSIADAVVLQRFLLGNGTLTNWKNADLCKDERIDVFDMVLMRRLLIESIQL